MKKDQNFLGVLPPKPPPRLCHEPIGELTAPQDTQLHFTTFKNSIFVQKETLVKLLGQMLALSIINSYSHLNDRDVLIYRDWLTE